MTQPRPQAVRHSTFLIFILIGLSGVLLFQNCGKAGFEDSGSNLGASDLLSNSTSSDAKLAGAPFPFDANLNMISYMSCPAGGGGAAKSKTSSAPYFNVRAGAYDNLPYATAFGAAALTAEEKNRRLKGGLSLRREFFNFVTDKYKRDDKDIFKQSLLAHPDIRDFQLVMGLVKRNGSRDLTQGGFSFSKSDFLATPLLDNLTSPVLAGYLMDQPSNGNSGTIKKSQFSSLEPSKQILVGTLGWGQYLADQTLFREELGTGLDLFLGYMKSPSAAQVDVTQFQSPEGKPEKSLYGKSYRFQMSASFEPADGISRQSLPNNHQAVVREISEHDLSTADEKNLTDEEAQDWDCFSLTVVRDPDRRHGSETREANGQVKTEFTGLPFEKPGIFDNVTSNNTIVRGVKMACPPQRTEYSDALLTQLSGRYGYDASSLRRNGLNVGGNRLRLEMARRFLPAEYFEINTGPDFMCVVPTAKASSLGQCYASLTDTETSKYVNYSKYEIRDASGTLDLSKPCGRENTNECPAVVSICYRKK